MKSLDILYEDNLVLIVNKPAGLAVQGGKNVKTSLDKILAGLRAPPPLLVHRLDKDTSGVLLAAKTKEAAALFSRLLSSGGKKTVKRYIAVCAGCPKEKEGIITQDIPVHDSMKKSRTRYKVIKTAKLPTDEKLPLLEFSVLEIELDTGRMHQIRRHLAIIGNPVLGDDKYGNFALNKKLRKAGVKRLLLHASHLVIEERHMDINAPMPECFLYFTQGYPQPPSNARL